MASQWSDRARHLRDAAAGRKGRARSGRHRAGGSSSAGGSREHSSSPTGEPRAGHYADEFLDELALTDDETMVLALLEYLMVERDVAAVTSPSTRPLKEAVRDRLADKVVATVLGATSEQAWHQTLVSNLAGVSAAEERAALVAAAPNAATSLGRRVGAMVGLVELHLFNPWPDGLVWSAPIRRRTLDEIATQVPALTPADNTRVQRELRIVARQLRRQLVNWGRVAAVGAAGLGLGALTGGVAAPLVGASIGAASGLSGAAATSAGLAALGGGSLAAGGFGIVGGTIFVTGLGAFAAGAAAAGGARATRWSTPGEIAHEALVAAVVTRLITLDQEHDEEKAKRVVMALQTRLDDVTATIARLGDRIRELAEENDELRSKLEAQRDEAQIAETTLQIAIDRIDVDHDRGDLLELEKADHNYDDQDEEQDKGKQDGDQN